MKKLFLTLIIGSIMANCTPSKPEAIVSFKVFCEMVANDAKPIALSHPLPPEEADTYQQQFEEVAKAYGVQVTREDDFPVTSLFPADVAKGKVVFVIYKYPRLRQYQQLKEDITTSKNETAQQIALARRMGRLLGYTPHGINNLLAKQTEFRPLSLFGIDRQTTHLYYENLEEAMAFYRETLGLPEEGPGLFQIGQDALLQIHNVDVNHPVGQPKSTAIALLTDQLPDWYAHIQKEKVPIKYTYKPKEGGPHDGFVAIDPGGYLLEFEQFKQHPENEMFMAVLAEAPKINTKIDGLNFYGSITWTYHKDLLAMQNFYENELGYQLVADQGWTKIFKTSSTGFIGLVDERRGMMDYADKKAVEITWQVRQQAEFAQYISKKEEWKILGRSFIGPEKYQYYLE